MNPFEKPSSSEEAENPEDLLELANSEAASVPGSEANIAKNRLKAMIESGELDGSPNLLNDMRLDEDLATIPGSPQNLARKQLKELIEGGSLDDNHDFLEGLVSDTEAASIPGSVENLAKSRLRSSQ